jgi:uncharacterized protein (TIGR03435 family)
MHILYSEGVSAKYWYIRSAGAIMRERAWCSSFVAAILLLGASSLAAQERPTHAKYEIISVRASDPNLTEGQISPLPNGIGYNAVRVTLRDMLAVMFRIPRRQIVGGPEWASTENFDILAKADQSYSIDELHEMFQDLLAERFNLKLHVVTATGPAYVLTVAPSGLKMVSVDPGMDRHNPITGIGGNRYKGDRVPLNYLCFWLGQNLQNDERPVVDGTGLTGTYNFDLTFRPQLPPSASVGDSGEPDDLPSIFLALKDQLGLILTSKKAPIQRLVIDHVEKPSEN